MEGAKSTTLVLINAFVEEPSQQLASSTLEELSVVFISARRGKWLNTFHTPHSTMCQPLEIASRLREF